MNLLIRARSAACDRTGWTGASVDLGNETDAQSCAATASTDPTLHCMLAADMNNLIDCSARHSRLVFRMNRRPPTHKITHETPAVC